MFFLQDHLISIMIAGIVLLALTKLFTEIRESGVETTVQTSGNIHALDFIKILQQDFHNIGADVDAADPMIVDYRWDNVGKYITFRGNVNPDTAKTVDQIRYRLVASDSIHTHLGDSLQLIPAYEIVREQDSLGVFKYTGSSINTVREFEITLRDAAGTILAANWDSTRQIEVRMITVPPLAPDQVSHHKEWRTSFRPASLTMKD